jgi:hypothetical protein
MKELQDDITNTMNKMIADGQRKYIETVIAWLKQTLMYNGVSTLRISITRLIEILEKQNKPELGEEE